MFVFLFGILGVLAIFPVAMNSASKSMGKVRSNVLAQSAIAQLTVDCTVPFVEGVVANSGVGVEDYVEVAGAPWAIDEWQGYFVRIIDGMARPQSRLIISNTNNRLTVCPPWDVQPSNTFPDRFIITRMGLPSLPVGDVQSWDSITLDLVAGNLQWQDDRWNGYYAVMEDEHTLPIPPLKGEFRRIQDTDVASTLTLEAGFAGSPVNYRFNIARIAPESPAQGTVDGATSGTDFRTNDGVWEDDQYNGLYVMMMDGSEAGHVRRIADTIDAIPGRLMLASGFDSNPSGGDAFRIVNPATRMGFVREFTGSNSFRAGFADRGDAASPDVAPLSWSAPWVESSVVTGTCPSDSAAGDIHLQVAGTHPGRLVIITGDPDSNPRAGQVRLISETGSTSTPSVFPDWAEAPTSADTYEIRDRLGHFLVITTGRAAGRIFRITGHSQDTTNGDEITCQALSFFPQEKINLREVGVTEAERGAAHKLRNATGFVILGTDSFLSTVIRHPGTAAGAVGGTFSTDYSYLLNSLGYPKTAEPQTGPDFYFEDANDREASEYSTVCIFSERGPFLCQPVRVDVFVFRNFNNAASLWKNQKPVGHVTGYVGEP